MSYDATAAVAYAELFHNRVCRDGFVATKLGYPKFPPGHLLDPVKEPIPHEDDCTHFISCCVGQTRGTITVDGVVRSFRGGGIHLDSPISHIVRGVYGEVTTPRAFGQIQIKGRAKIVEPRFMDKKAPATREAIRRNLRKGDIVAYARDKVLHKGVGNYEHMCIVVKIDPTKAGDVIGIACHTIARFGEDFLDVRAFDFVTLLRFP